MIRLMSTAGQAMALPEAGTWESLRGTEGSHASDARHHFSHGELWPEKRRKVHDTITIPTRGILLGSVLSSCLWAVLIAGGRALWLYLR